MELLNTTIKITLMVSVCSEFHSMWYKSQIERMVKLVNMETIALHYFKSFIATSDPLDLWIFEISTYFYIVQDSAYIPQTGFIEMSRTKYVMIPLKSE